GRRRGLGPPATTGIPFSGQHETHASFWTSFGGVIHVSGWNTNADVPVLLSAPTCVVPSPSAVTVAASALPSMFQSPATRAVLLQDIVAAPSVAMPPTWSSANREAADIRCT